MLIGLNIFVSSSKYFNDLSVEEIGEITNVPINTVKTRLSRARKKLKYLLKEEA